MVQIQAEKYVFVPNVRAILPTRAAAQQLEPAHL
jgi:hypothetical protein